jgi:hypothetical protein
LSFRVFDPIIGAKDMKRLCAPFARNLRCCLHHNKRFCDRLTAGSIIPSSSQGAALMARISDFHINSVAIPAGLFHNAGHTTISDRNKCLSRLRAAE